MLVAAAEPTGKPTLVWTAAERLQEGQEVDPVQPPVHVRNAAEALMDA
jgi:hypothetical protein